MASSSSNYQSLQQTLGHIVNLLCWQMIVKMRKWSRKVALILKSRGICQSLLVAKLQEKKTKSLHQLSACHSQISVGHGIYSVCIKPREWFRLHPSTSSNSNEVLNIRILFAWLHKMNCVIFSFGKSVLCICRLWSIYTNTGERFCRKGKLRDLSNSVMHPAIWWLLGSSFHWRLFRELNLKSQPGIY